MSSSKPWPRAVLEEMLDCFMETAQQEGIVMSMLRAKQEASAKVR